MKYFLDFDRTIYDTDAFKKEIKKRPPVLELLRQGGSAFAEFIAAEKGITRRRTFFRTFGTFASHGRFALEAEVLREFLYPDAVEFLKTHSCTIVTYGVRAFITAKVATALTDFPDLHVEYTSRHKGRTIRRLTKDETEQCIFIDDKVFQLASVSAWCPKVKCIEIRRDKRKGDGRWPVIHSFEDLDESNI